MKRVGLVLLVVCMLIFGFVITPVISLSELNNDSAGQKAGARTRTTLIVGSGQTYTTIDAAVTAAQPGDTIRVYAGVYTEVIELTKRLSLVGNGSADTIIDSQTSSAPISIKFDRCNVTGFTLKGSGNGATDAGIIINSSFNHVYDCNSSSNAGHGIRLESAGFNNTIENCTVTYNGRAGIKIIDSYNNLVRGCTIRYNSENGIDFQSADSNTIENNSISDSLSANHPTISFSSSEYNIIKFNQLRNDKHAISLTMGDFNVIIGNTMVSTSDYAMILGGNSDDNVIYHNNFIDCNNTGSGKQVSDSGTGNIWDNGYPSGGNYWSDWTSPDFNTTATQDQPGSDGIVDFPYDIDVGINDSYPLANPFVILKITNTDIIIATEDVPYSNTYTAWTNMFNNTLSWLLNSNATWLTKTGSTISGTPANADVGSYWVNVTVTDGTNEDSHNFTLTVLNVNDPPFITTLDIFTVNETQLYSVDYNASDIDPTNDILAWGVNTNATFPLSMAPGTGVLSGTPSRADLGSYFVNVTVNDGHDGWDYSNFTLTVLNLNDPPTIITPDNLTVNEMQFYSVDYEAIDIDPTNDTLTWGALTNATFLSMVSGTGVLSGTPLRADLGSYYVNVTVNDGNGGWDHSNFTLTVLNVNDPPIINSSWSDFSFDEDTVDESISLNDWFMDYDGDELTFSFSGNEKLTATILATGYVRLVPEANWSGYELLTFYANDSVLHASDTVNVTILPVNDAPYDAMIEVLVTNLTEDRNQTVMGNASDVDIPYGDMLTYSWSSNSSGFIGTGQEINLSLDAGFYNIILNVTDSEGAWTLVSKDIEILLLKVDIDINESDTDGDNLPDDWERYYFGDLIQGRDDDPDKDNFTNYQEWENNTNPNDPEDYPGKIDDTDDDDDDKKETTFMEDYWWLVLLLILIIIIIIIIFFLVSRKKKEEEEPKEEEEMFECPECGARVGTSEAFCPECGTKFEEDEEILVCPECGVAVGAGITQCPECGVEFEEGVEAGEGEEELPKDEELPEGEEQAEGKPIEGAGEVEEETPAEPSPEDVTEPVQDEEPVTEEEPVKDEEPVEEDKPPEDTPEPEEPKEEENDTTPPGEEPPITPNP